MCVLFRITPGKQGTPMRRVAADGGLASANGYGSPIRRLALGAALASLVSLVAMSGQAQSVNVNSTRAAAPPAKDEKKKEDDKKAEKKDDKKSSGKEKRYA